MITDARVTAPEAANIEERLEAASVVLRAIRERRSIGKVTDEAPSAELIRKVLEAGTWAPNHHLTEPWRFFVLTGEARNGLGEAMAAAAARLAPTPEAAERASQKAVGKPLRAPYVIAIAAVPDPSVPVVEEIAAASAAAQNMLLAAHALGLGAIWRSGELAFTPEVKSFLELSESCQVLGFLYVGFPAMEPPQRERRSIDDVATWWDSRPE
jgi:nitroreductase